MQAGRAFKKVKITQFIPGGPDGTGGTLPGTDVVLLDTRCEFRQITSAVTLEAYQFGTNEVFEIKFRKRLGFTLNAVKQNVSIDAEQYVIKRPIETRRDHILTIIKRV